MTMAAPRRSTPTRRATRGREVIRARMRTYSRLAEALPEEFRDPQRKLDWAASGEYINVPLTIAIARALDMGVLEWFAICAADCGFPVDPVDDPRLDRLVSRLMAMTEKQQDLVLDVADLIERRAGRG
jgi:hypothetical protein